MTLRQQIIKLPKSRQRFYRKGWTIPKIKPWPKPKRNK